MNRKERRAKAKLAQANRRAINRAAPRLDRIEAYCDWLESIPPDPPFWTLPAFAQFADLTKAEMEAAQHELGERAADSEWELRNLSRLAGIDFRRADR